MKTTFDVIVVGGGPGGSSLAALLARQRASTLVLDKAAFPRDKVCGDGLTPRAIYWLDVLGCLDEVVTSSRSYLTEAELYIDNYHALTGTFSATGAYPGFSIILKRRVLDHIMLRHAVSQGAAFRPDCVVKGLRQEPGCVVVEGLCEGTRAEFRSRVVIGADGANSMVSRAIGNKIMDGVTAVSMRGYFEGPKVPGSGMKVYFDEQYFPGYGWIFAGDDGIANVGVGLAADENFPLRTSIRQIYDDFVAARSKDVLHNAREIAKPKGGWSSFFRPGHMVANRVALIGDAANLGDPMNGGGIHTAMESAHLAAPAVLEALRKNDCSAASLGRYEAEWTRVHGLNWQVGELFLTIGKNAPLRQYWLYALKVMSELARNDPRLRDFAGGLFTGTTDSRRTITPASWLQAVPADPGIWMSAVTSGLRTGTLDGPLAAAKRAAGEIVQDPRPTQAWTLEVLSKLAGVANSAMRQQTVAPKA